MKYQLRQYILHWTEVIWRLKHIEWNLFYCKKLNWKSWVVFVCCQLKEQFCSFLLNVELCPRGREMDLPYADQRPCYYSTRRGNSKDFLRNQNIVEKRFLLLFSPIGGTTRLERRSSMARMAFVLFLLPIPPELLQYIGRKVLLWQHHSLLTRQYTRIS